MSMFVNNLFQEPSRRGVLQVLAAGGMAGLTGCCSMRPFATPAIAGDVAPVGTLLKPTIRKSPLAPKLCIDAHTHFFNGTDVPVKGYLAGPIAHDLDEPLRSLVRSLAPLADALVEIAPTAAEEFRDLSARFSGASVTGKAAATDPFFRSVRVDDRAKRSEDFYRIVRGSEFEAQYNALKRAQRSDVKSLLSSSESNLLGPSSLLDAANASGVPSRDKALSLDQQRIVNSVPYADGILAFVNHMLSPRWHNLLDYAEAYSAAEGAFGIDHVLGSLVDFDGWLDCPPRSAQDDQVKLHQMLSMASGGYLRPLVAYNPWSDIRSNGASLERVKRAITELGFIGVKIYPPNGFYPYRNTSRKGSPTVGPSFRDLDRVLETLWDTCISLNVPVMAHTNNSSGKDDDFDLLGGPSGWHALLARYKDRGAPLVNLGHFGGAGGGTSWTADFADMMASKGGEKVYGDVGFWDALRCRDGEAPACGTAKLRLGAALKKPGVNKRIMYGTDWLMLSTQRDWADYPYELLASIKHLPIAPEDFFGLNAQRCFSTAGLGAAI